MRYYDLPPERDISYEDLEIVDCWIDNTDVYFTVDIGDNLMVDVIYPRLLEKYLDVHADISFESNYSYIVICTYTGSEIYDAGLEGKEYRNLRDSEYSDILEYVDDNASEFVRTH